jgi:signal transduction histidine kinase/CheY-like chemotaxis protein
VGTIGSKLISWINESWNNFVDMGLSDGEEARLGKLLVSILALGVIITIPLTLTLMYLYVAGLGGRIEIMVAFTMTIAYIPCSIYCYYRARSHSIMSAATLYVRITFIAVLAAIFIFDGTRSSGSWILFCWPIMISGVLIAPSQSVKMALWVIIYYFVMLGITISGMYQPPLSFVPEGRELTSLLYTLTLLLFAVGTITTLTMVSLKQSMLSLKKAKKEIESQHSLLEVKVEDRTKELWDEIVKRKQAEQQKEETQKQAFLISKLASIGELASGVAHEINNPLAIIYGHLELLKNDLENNPLKALKHIRGVHRAAERINKIVDGLRTYARKDTDEITPIDIHQAVKDTMGIVGTIYMNDGIKIKKELRAIDSKVEGNVSKVQQVILSLLSNAHDAVLDNRGEIIIRTYNVENLNSQHKDFVLEIIDNGCGIPKDNLERIFDPFYTTKDPDKGSGLGLSMSHSIIHSIDGTISVNSEEGKGTTVKVNFPTFTQIESITVDEISEFIQVDSGTKVLLLNDEIEVNTLLVHHIDAIGLKVEACDDGSKLLELINEKKYEYIIADISLRSLSGEDLFQAKQECESLGTKFILITDETLEGISAEMKRFLLEKADAYIKKPFSKDDFFKILKHVA